MSEGELEGPGKVADALQRDQTGVTGKGVGIKENADVSKQYRRNIVGKVVTDQAKLPQILPIEVLQTRVSSKISMPELGEGSGCHGGRLGGLPYDHNIASSAGALLVWVPTPIRGPERTPDLLWSLETRNVELTTALLLVLLNHSTRSFSTWQPEERVIWKRRWNHCERNGPCKPTVE